MSRHRHLQQIFSDLLLMCYRNHLCGWWQTDCDN
jgi:hypothetical protein